MNSWKFPPVRIRLADLFWFFTLTAVVLWGISLQLRLNRSLELISSKRRGSTLFQVDMRGGDSFYFDSGDLKRHYRQTYEKVLAVEVEPVDDGLKSVLKKSAR